MIASMAMSKRPKGYRRPTQKGDGIEPPLFLTEWMEKRRVSDLDMAVALREDRTTIWKWRRYPTRLDPLKMARVAAVLGIWPPQLWVRPDSREDKILQAVSPEPGPWTPPDIIPKVPRPPRK